VVGRVVAVGGALRQRDEHLPAAPAPPAVGGLVDDGPAGVAEGVLLLDPGPAQVHPQQDGLDDVLRVLAVAGEELGGVLQPA
jgi:hypothetical protein